MSATLADHRTPEWHAEQRRTIGGSLAAATVGEHEFITPLEAYYALAEGRERDIAEKPDVIRGRLLEPIAMQRLADVMGTEVEPHPQQQFVYNAKYPYAHTLPDAWLPGKEIAVEVKIPTPWNFERLDERIPMYIQAQLNHTLACTGANLIMLVCMDPVSMEIWRQTFVRDEETIELLMEGEERFWVNYVLARQLPDPSNLDDCKLRWPRHEPGKRVEADAEVLEAHAELLAAKVEKNATQKRIAGHELAIKSYMGDAETLIDERGRRLATWTHQTANVFDRETFEADNPEMARGYRKTRESRVFRPKDPTKRRRRRP